MRVSRMASRTVRSNVGVASERLLISSGISSVCKSELKSARSRSVGSEGGRVGPGRMPRVGTQSQRGRVIWKAVSKEAIPSERCIDRNKD